MADFSLILTAGEGSRLRPLTRELPKALVPTLGAPQMAWSLALAAAAGIRRCGVNTRGEQPGIERCARSAGGELDMEIEIFREPPGALGTAGALRNAAGRLTSPFLVVNSDIVTDAPLTGLLAAHASSGATATLLAVPVEEDADLRVEESWVAGLLNRAEGSGPGHRYGGIGVFEPDCLNLIPAGSSGLYETVLTGLAEGSGSLAAWEWEGYWLDMGTPAAYLRANLDALAGHFGPAPPSVAKEQERWDHLAYVARGAQVEGARLRHVVAGRGAVIHPEASCERCVVWEGAEVGPGSWRDAVFTQSGAVRI